MSGRPAAIRTTRQLDQELRILAFSFERRYSTETVPDELHETSRAIQSSRLVPVTFRTMST